MKFTKKYRLELLIFAVALAMRLFFLPGALWSGAQLDTKPIAFDGYYEIAGNVVAGHGFTTSQNEPREPDSVRVPLYPLLIAGTLLVAGSYKIFLLLQVLVGSLVPLLGKRLAELLTKNPRIGVGVGFFMAIEPFTAWVSTVFLTETFFTFFFLIGCIMLFTYLDTRRAVHIAVSAVFLGLATLVKPTPQLLPILFVIVIIAREWRPSLKTLKHLGLFLFLFYLMLTPWTYRNHLVFGNANLNVQSVSALYSYLVPSAIALQKGIPFQQAQNEFHREEHVKDIGDINLGNTKEYRKRAFEVLAQYPVGFVESLVVTFVTFFTHDGYRTFTDNYQLLSFQAPGITVASAIKHPSMIPSLLTPGTVLILIGRTVWTLTSILGLIGLALWAWQRRFSTETIITAVIIFYFAATTAIIGLSVNGRFRNPINVFLITLALFATLRIKEYINRRPHRTS